MIAPDKRNVNAIEANSIEVSAIDLKCLANDENVPYFFLLCIPSIINLVD
jgi:hypothetical protein